MTKKQKLELTWIGKDHRPKLEPRILLEDNTKTYHAKHRVTENDIFDNKLIFGDNLLALKALEQEYTGKVKCVYIDPPFNTGGAFEHYDDNLEHSIWLNLMYQRLLILRNLLSTDGAIAIQLDDSEAAHCKVMADEVFGRGNYIGTVTVEAATTSSFKTVNVGPTQVSNFIFLYAKDKSTFKYNVPYVGSREIDLAHFSRFIINFEDVPEKWRFQSINSHILKQMGFGADTIHAQWSLAKKALGAEEATDKVTATANEFALENAYRVFETKTLQKPSKWLLDKIEESKTIRHVLELKRENMDSIYLLGGRQVYFLGKGIREIDGERCVAQPVSNIWTDIPTNNLQKEGGISFPAGKKPEVLLRRIIQMFTSKPDDIVLDSFGGSGTTAAVAHKMKRRWISIEMGEHCHTHIIPRMQNIINGNDPYGVTEPEHWRGGGGFRYYSLAPSLITFDKYNQPVINKGYNPVMLSQAMCKLMGFTYTPSDTVYWQQGHSTETDFIYVTTQTLDQGQLSALSEEAGENRTLLICCAAFRGNTDKFENLTVKKIPRAVLDKCEWDKDDYSLNVQNLPMLEPEPSTNIPTVRAKRAAKQASGDLPLFGDDADAKKTSVKRK